MCDIVRGAKIITYVQIIKASLKKEIIWETENTPLGPQKVSIELSAPKMHEIPIVVKSSQIVNREVSVVVRMRVCENELVLCDNGKKLFRKTWYENNKKVVAEGYETLRHIMKYDGTKNQR